MQCPSCGFENMPGSEGCGRCGSSLRLSTATLDVNPPRAGKNAKFWRRLGRPVVRFQMQFQARKRTAPKPSLIPLNIMLPLFVPGLVQLRDGHRSRGRFLMGSYFAFLAIGVIFFGTSWGSIALGLAAAAHVGSVYDALQEHLPPEILDVRRRTLAVFITIFVLAGIYTPIVLAVWRVAQPITSFESGGSIHAG